ncbi:hypothetical protein Lal_00027179 [Lupinus albus]|nr:hypothetical protein Lal_00027179 [Lupinus albus]
MEDSSITENMVNFMSTTSLANDQQYEAYYSIRTIMFKLPDGHPLIFLQLAIYNITLLLYSIL